MASFVSSGCCRGATCSPPRRQARPAVVVFDRDGRVLGTIVVCFTCHEWIVAPRNDANGGDAPSVMSAAGRRTLQAIFEAHRLGARLYGDDDYADRVHDYERRAYGTRELPTAAGLERGRQRLLPGSGVPKDRPMRGLGKDDRVKLCAFFGRVHQSWEREGPAPLSAPRRAHSQRPSWRSVRESRRGMAQGVDQDATSKSR